MITGNYNNTSDRGLEEKLTENFYKWCQETTSHGIPNIIKGRTIFIRVMWLIFFLGSLGYCFYVVISTMIKFSQYETSISIEITPELPAKFPAVTFCNINPFNEARSSKYLSSSEVNNLLLAYQCINEGPDQFLQCLSDNQKTTAVLDSLLENLKAYVANDESVKANRSELGYRRDELVMFCSFNGDSCNASNFQSYWDSAYGNCYTFNYNSSTSGNPYLNVSRTGPNYGLELEIAVKPPNVQTVYAYKSGLYLKIHNQSSLPFTLNSGINIPTGFETYIGVSRTSRTLLESPYSDCKSDLKSTSNYSKVLYGYFNDLNVDYYDQEFCYTLCYQDRLIDVCGCGDIVGPRIRNNTKYCEAIEDVDCLIDFRKQYLNVDIGIYCESACPPQCKKIDYNLITSMAVYPSESYLTFLKNTNYTKNYFPEGASNDTLLKFARETILKIKINYDKLYYTEINDQEKMTFQDFLGNWGGQFGLFIGISFLSFVELIELGIECVIIYIGHLKESRRKKNSRFWR